MSDAEEPVSGQSLRIANEFADVVVRKVLTRNGERLEIAAPRRGVVIHLCPLELEALAGSSDSALTELLGRYASEPGDGE